MRFDNRLLDEIRARLNLSDIVGRRVTWDRRKTQPGKGDFWACCPFHQEKSPSFHVDDRRGRYKCFGCGASGDHFRFLTDTEGLSFPEAVERLAGQAGVALPAPDPQAARRERKRASLAEVCEMAARFFQMDFAGPRGEVARAYAARRNLSPATLQEFRVGFAPESRDALKRHLTAQGVDEAAMVEAGLVIKPDDGRPSYDRFRGRLMIPIHDERGRVVAFGGRTLDPNGQPKYLNSPETPLFHKGVMLFNVHRAREPAFKAGQAVVVEGYLDAIALWQAGLKHVVATLGTAFTEDQIIRLWKLAPEPVVCFDGDAAGVAAAHRAIDRIFPVLRSGCSFQFCFLPDGQDPDDLIRARGLAGFLEEVRRAQPLSEAVWEREVSVASLDTPERKAALEKRFEDLIATIRDERVRRRYQLDIRFRLSNLFFERARRSGAAAGAAARPAALARVSAPEGPMFGTERLVCGLCVRYPDLLDRHIERIAALGFADELHARFRDELCRVATDLDATSVADFFESLDERFYQILSEVMAAKPESNGSPPARAGFSDLLQRFPLLRNDPPEDFVEAVFLHFLDGLELRALERELQQELGGEDDVDEEAWNRIRGLSQDLARRREECAREEAALAEWAKKLRSPQGVGATAPDSLVSAS
ncbi:DNA primase [Polymorphum gilvum]|uniref:DNA primase n=1 Tax=Polymorphum gilvum (strain LMG 25793 / CGMCC 1.9160 / SL003B-26A1) TaxID=991905 RepID=F2J0M6_POLGS|nr:DNA primase [Polymorphum gilvum]ADZ69694.1 DNA primase catalytic core, N-terminal domain family [Polymorphum gilvum SL003B-26A1]